MLTPSSACKDSVMTDSSAASVTLQFSPRPRRAARRIVVVGFATLLMAGLVFFVTEVWIPLDRLHEINQTAFARIDCSPQYCDPTDVPFAGSSYE
jgi:hypothetical protein